MNTKKNKFFKVTRNEINSIFSRRNYILISAVTLLLIFISKSFIIRFLRQIALTVSSDAFVKVSTINILFYIGVISILMFLILGYCLIFTKLFKSKENRVIIFIILIEYIITLTIFAFKEYLLSDPVNNVFAYINFVQLLLAGILCCYLSILYKRNLKNKVMWVLFSLGFIIVSLDEILEVHEYVGNILLFPQIKDTLFGMIISNLFHNPDDFILFIYVLGAIAVILIFFKVLKEYILLSRKFVFLFIMAFVTITFQIFAERFEFYFLEEAFEIFSSLFFILSFFVLLNRARAKGGFNKKYEQ